MNNEEYVNYYLFWLFHLGISNSTLSNMYHRLDLYDFKKIYAGRYGDYAISSIKFTNKELQLLSEIEYVEQTKLEVIDLMNKFERYHVRILFYYDNDYPAQLKNIKNPPIFLFARGNFNRLNIMPMISVSGTRKISENSALKLEKTITELVEAGFGIVSGLAIGTDVIANRQAYESSGYSVAVIPSSIFDIQPKSNVKVADKIIQRGGAILSEYYSDDFDKSRYINRNRLISGLGSAVLIPEFDVKSGTMHTARYAWRQKKPIFTFNNESTGVLKILNQGYAHLYQSVSDLINILGGI